jgi:hypothetical protein
MHRFARPIALAAILCLCAVAVRAEQPRVPKLILDHHLTVIAPRPGGKPRVGGHVFNFEQLRRAPAGRADSGGIRAMTKVDPSSSVTLGAVYPASDQLTFSAKSGDGALSAVLYLSGMVQTTGSAMGGSDVAQVVILPSKNGFYLVDFLVRPVGSCSSIVISDGGSPVTPLATFPCPAWTSGAPPTHIVFALNANGQYGSYLVQLSLEGVNGDLGLEFVSATVSPINN